MKQIVSLLNSISPQQVIEHYFAKKFAEQGKFNEYFTVSKIKFPNCDTIRDVINCKDVCNLLQFVLSARTVFGQHLVKVGIDGDRDFLKMSLGSRDNS